MTNIYGVPDEVDNNAPSERRQMPTCPRCRSDAGVYITNETVTAVEYTCATCGLVFYTVEPIPF